MLDRILVTGSAGFIGANFVYYQFDKYKDSIVLILNKGHIGESYNISGINEWTNISIDNLLCEKIGSLFKDNESYRIKYPECPASIRISTKSLITYVKGSLGHDRRYAIDASKIMSELGYRLLETLETGIHKTILWYLDNDT